MLQQLRQIVVVLVFALLLGASVAAAAGNPHGTPPGQAKATSSETANTNDGQATSGGSQSSAQADTAPATVSGKFAGCTASASQGAGVKPNNTTEHWTCATAGSNQTKLYGNGTTAGQIALSRGAPPGTVLYGPGNSQPHKVAVCKHGKTHLLDVHAVKAYGNAGACTTTSAHSSSASATSTGAASGSSSPPAGVANSSTTTNSSAPTAAATPTLAPAIQIGKNERDQTTGGTFSAGPIDVKLGDRVDYQITIYNNGNVDLIAHLVDPGCIIRGGHTLDFSGISLKVHETKLYHCSHVITPADAPVYTNTATVNGVSASAAANGSASVSASSSVAAAPAQASVKADVSSVLGARKVIVHHIHKAIKAHKTHKAPKKVTAKAKPAVAKVKAASFTG